MNAVLQCILLTTLCVEFIVGSLVNAFIVLVNIMDWVKRRNLSFIDQIFTALAISRMGFLCSIITSILAYELYPDIIMTKKLVREINISWTVTNHFSIWLATSLSIFYFLKIAIFSNSIFHLKWRVKQVVSVTLLASLLIFFSNILIINRCTDGWIDAHEANVSYSAILSTATQISRLIILINAMFTLIPFTVSLTMVLLLIFSLWRHLKNMQGNATGFRDISTAAHIKALKMVVTFLLMYTIFFLSILVQFCNLKFQKKNFITLFFSATGLAFPSGHSYVLILGNTKLREAFLSLAWWLRCRLRNAEP
ncbi:taste receptor type 2 member 140-like [Arvicanthis niloticus]|uniref:taste receptor type 2 member 140-like n=1 Tax=Arvicanthis niloticus TaxID=61156 RepID=UPI001486D643|nr:taste receptor type 2 member 140-like [Arvicanthis niloticus]